MARTPVTAGGVTYPSKSKLKNDVRAILHSAPLDTNLGGEQRALLVELLRARSSKAELLPDEPQVSVGFNEYGNRTFVFLCKRGERRTFSYAKAVDELASGLDSVRESVNRYKKAMRDVVLPDIMAFKSAHASDAGLLTCAVSGVDALWDEVHVDHEYPVTFDHLLYEFTRKEKVRIGKVPLRRVEFYGWECADAALASRWREYHEQYARLRIVSASVNLSQPKTEFRDWRKVV